VACQARACQHGITMEDVARRAGSWTACHWAGGRTLHVLHGLQARWRAERALELVHGDLCGPISPVTPSGNTYFLLLVDDRSRYMWSSVLVTKDQATAVIKDFQARTKGESGCKLMALHTDRGGEFNSTEFA
jgi:hypothetical protein